MVRPADLNDHQQLSNLIFFETRLHRHLDWRTPLEWLGAPYKEIYDSVDSIASLFSGIKKYAGTHALLYKSEEDAVIFNDALALREIYYSTAENQIVCGSQPNMLAKFANTEIRPRRDPDFLEFYVKNSKNSRWNPYCKWIGDETYYEGVKHLLPNHYLDINRGEALRYWPNEPIKRLDLNDAVSKICLLLQGTIRAMVYRYSVMMAVTSGTDSRTLLAASKVLSDPFRVAGRGRSCRRARGPQIENAAPKNPAGVRQQSPG